MRHLWRSHARDEERVVREYARCEEAGDVPRNSNRYAVPPLEYARRLLDDGLRKGWLDGTPRSPSSPLPAASQPRLAAPTAVPATIPPAIGLSRLQWADQVMRALGAEPESSTYLERVRAWREAWRPERVRVLLVAESHVAEQAGDIAVTVCLPNRSHAEPPLPDGYCRLVYCLGYGEPALCSPRSPTGNAGTWQYWDLLGAAASACNREVSPSMPRRAMSDLRARLEWKLRVLATLREAGIWLEDASVIALYSPGGRRLTSGAAYDQIVRTSFANFVWPSVARDAPEQIWIIGRGVGRALRGLPGTADARLISQPQDRDQQRYRADVSLLGDALSGIR